MKKKKSVEINEEEHKKLYELLHDTRKTPQKKHPIKAVIIKRRDGSHVYN